MITFPSYDTAYRKSWKIAISLEVSIRYLANKLLIKIVFIINIVFHMNLEAKKYLALKQLRRTDRTTLPKFINVCVIRGWFVVFVHLKGVNCP